MTNVLTGSWVALFLAACSGQAVAQDERFPLEPPDTTSPRGVLFNLVDNLSEVQRLIDDARREQYGRAEELLKRATRSLNLGELPPATREYVGLESALQLKEVLDRVPLPPAETIPDAQASEAQELTRWRVPHTGINIVQVAEGPRTGEFLFDPRTVTRAREMYQTVRHLPLLTGKSEGLYERYVSTPGGLMPPRWLAWVESLPDWSRDFFFGKTPWQWTALGLTVLVIFLVPYALSRWQRRIGPSSKELLRVFRQLIVPSGALLGLWFAESFLVPEISFTGQGLINVLNGLLVANAIFATYVSYLLPTLVAEGVISSPRIDAASLDANMIRLVARILGLVFGTLVVLFAADELGVPVVPLIASLGVGGIAIALAARPTFENLIGGIILYTDRPVRVGDFCTFGDIMGTVEQIGVRSTQIRALDRTVVTVPNATFADMQLINWARCDMMLIRTVISLRYETKLEQLRYVLARLREMCHAHPKIDNDTVRVRFVGFGSSSLDIQIRIYALTRDWNDFFAIQEDVMLRVAEIVEESGTSFAFPSQTLYLGRDTGLDAERSDQAIHEVQRWRSAGELPFPNMAHYRREQLADTLDYPPHGSAEARSQESPEGEAAEPLSKEPDSDDQPDDPERHE